MPRSQFSTNVSNWINQISQYCGTDTDLALLVLEATRAGFILPSSRVIPVGPTRTVLQNILCSVAGISLNSSLPEGNGVQFTPPTLSLKQRLRRAMGLSVTQEQQSLLHTPVVQSEADEANRLLTKAIKQYEAHPATAGDLPFPTSEEYYQLRAYIGFGFVGELNRASAQSAYQLSKFTPLAFGISSVASLNSYFLAFRYWLEKKWSEFVAGLYASCSYLYSLFIVFYYSDLRYRYLFSKSNIFEERPLWFDTILTVLLWVQTLLSAWVSPYLNLTTIPYQGLRIVAGIISFASPITSNSGVLERLKYGPLRSDLHMLVYYRNPRTRPDLMKRHALIKTCTDFRDVTQQLDNERLDEVYQKLLGQEARKQSDQTMSQLRTMAQTVYENHEKKSWYARQSWLMREIIYRLIWLPVFVLSVIAFIYYRPTGKAATNGWYFADRLFDSTYNKTTDIAPSWYLDSIGTIVGINSAETNSWYGVSPIFFFLSFIYSLRFVINYGRLFKWDQLRTFFGRLFTWDQLGTIVFALGLAYAPTVAAIQLANTHTDALYIAEISIPVILLMNLLSIFKMKGEARAKYLYHNYVFKQDPNLSPCEQNHIANCQLFLIECLIDAMVTYLSKSNPKAGGIAQEYLQAYMFKLHQVTPASEGPAILSAPQEVDSEYGMQMRERPSENLETFTDYQNTLNTHRTRNHATLFSIQSTTTRNIFDDFEDEVRTENGPPVLI